MKRVLSLITLSCLLSWQVKAGDGTLPFGDGTLPFNMAGTISADQQGSAEFIEMFFNGSRSLGLSSQVFSESLTLSSGPYAESGPCRRPMNWFPFGGQLSVGQNSYTIQGVCANGLQPGQRVVIASRGRETLHLEGNLRGPSNRQTFSGQATLSNGGQTVKTYRFTLSD